jgi:hypothetical protein
VQVIHPLSRAGRVLAGLTVAVSLSLGGVMLGLTPAHASSLSVQLLANGEDISNPSSGRPRP